MLPNQPIAIISYDVLPHLCGEKFSFQYDDDGNLVKIKGAGQNNASSSEAGFEYSDNQLQEIHLVAKLECPPHAAFSTMDVFLEYDEDRIKSAAHIRSLYTPDRGLLRFTKRSHYWYDRGALIRVADNDRITAEWQYNDVNQVVKHVYEKEKVCISYNKYEYPDTMEIESSSGEKTIRKWEYAETNWPAREFIVSDGKWRLSAVYSMVKSDDVVDVTPSVTNLFFSYAGKSLAVIMCPEDSHQVFKIRLDDMTVENVPRFPSIYVVSFKNGSCWHFVRHDDNVTMDQDIEMNDRSMVVAIRNSVSENGNIGKIVRPVFTVNQFGFSVRNRIRYYPVVECEAWRRFSEVTEI